MRLRIFAGPNGSGKSTIINAIRKYKVKGRSVDFGIYVNADDILRKLSKDKLSFSTYTIKTTNKIFYETALKSGLVSSKFDENVFKNAYRFENNCLILLRKENGDRIAQIIADFLRKELLKKKKKFSFETVFSHKSKVEFIKTAKAAGYKVYLYFVATEDPIINKFRVKVRVKQGGHPVPENKIESRYYRSLDQLYDAAQLAYQCFFFDNSNEGQNFRLVQHFKVVGKEKKWDKKDSKQIPNWFIQYYSKKI